MNRHPILHSFILGDKNKNTIFILHGLLGSAINWRQLAKRFMENYQIHLIDLRNHGNSFQDPNFDYQSMARDIEAYRIHYNIVSPILLGHSMGGKVAMKTCAIYKGTYKKLIIVDIANTQYFLDEHRFLLEGMVNMPIDEMKSREEAENYLSDYEKDKMTVQFVLKNLSRDKHTQKLIWKINLKFIYDGLNHIGVAPLEEEKITLPTLLIRGGKSNYVTDVFFENMKKNFTQIQLETLSKSGHLVHIEEPDRFFEKLLNFL